ncbi:MAG: YggS family pyridoxal phosphate-dependent enzyme [Bacteroidales bacterium]|nr:YggS family pyridoxal phosphate-dependent enzyme [Bacteroidales bacterium]
MLWKKMQRASNIEERLQEIKSNLPETVRLVAVSKFHPVEAIQEAYAAGQRLFGESRAQELVPKQESLPKDIEWHFIGHLQENKVRHIAPFVSLIHSVDSLKLLREIDKQGAKCGRVIPCLLEIFVAQEETKYGFTMKECEDLLQSAALEELSHVEIRGFMGMASLTEDEQQIRAEFGALRTFFEKIRREVNLSNVHLSELSMGMSHDYTIAVEEGSTMVRIGTTIFGERVY